MAWLESSIINMQNDFFSQPVDKAALALTRSIALAESGGSGGNKPDYNAVGDAGTSHGAYQWQPGNFEAGAKAAGLNPKDMSPENQDKVAYYQVKKMKDEGYAPDEIPAAWNAGLGRVKDGSWKTNKGTTVINGKPIEYDTPGYVKKVNDHYQKIYAQMGGGTQPTAQLTNSTPQPTQSPQGKGFVTSATMVPPANTSTPVNQPDNRGLGDKALNFAGNISKKILDVTGGNKVANLLGTEGAVALEKGKGLIGMKDNSRFIPHSADDVDVVGTALDAGKLGTSLFALKGLANVGNKVLPSAVNPTFGALPKSISTAAPIVEDITGVSAKKFAASRVTDQVNALDQAYKATTVATDRIILKNAMEELAPKVLAENGIGSFSALHPKSAKAIGLTAGAFKSLAKIVGLGVAFGTGQRLTEGLIPK